MSLPIAIGGAGILGAGASLFGASQSANAIQQSAAQAQAAAKQAYGQNQGILAGLTGDLGAAQGNIAQGLTAASGSISAAYNQAQGIIAGIPTVSQEYPQAQQLSQQDFDYRTGIQRQNLDFVLGNTQNSLRSAQTLNTSLANLDPSGFNAGTNKIINSSESNLKALTQGEPTGSFANLSAQNLQNFSQQGLSNELAISDFFSQQGTVEPVSPLQTAFGLQGVAQSIAGLGIQNAQWQGQGLANVDLAGVTASQNIFGDQAQIAGMGINSNNLLASLLSSTAGASGLAQAQSAQAIGPAIGLASSGLIAGAGIGLQQQSLANQTSFQQSLLGSLGGNSLGTGGFSNAQQLSLLGGSATGLGGVTGTANSIGLNSFGSSAPLSGSFNNSSGLSSDLFQGVNPLISNGAALQFGGIGTPFSPIFQNIGTNLLTL